MKELAKVEYTPPIEELLPVSNEQFPSETFVDFNSPMGRMYYGGTGGVQPKFEIQQELFIEKFNELAYVYAHPNLNAPYAYNADTRIWNEVNLGNYNYSDWYFENILAPKFSNQFKNPEFGNAIRKEMKKVAGELASRSMVRGEHAPLGDNPNPNIIAFENGTYDFKTNNIRETKLEDYHTLQLPYPLIKTNETDELLAKQWIDYLLKDQAQTLYEFIGYMYYREYKYQSILYLLGNGSNGKSYVGGFIMNKLIGFNNSSAVGLDSLADKNNRFDKASLHHKLLNFEADSSANFVKGTETLKKLSGGLDAVHAEKKGKDAFSFTNYAKLMFSMNELPAFNDRTNGWYRRILILNFNTNLDTPEARERINEFNRQREERESKEQLGKFAWFCIQQFKKILDAGSNGENPFTETAEMVEFKKAYVESNDPSKEFLNETPVLIKDENGSVKVSVLKNIFNVYTKENNINKSMNWRTMKELLIKAGYEEKRTKNERVMLGITIGKNGDSEAIKPYLATALASSEYVNIFNDVPVKPEEVF